jgi:anthranilate synthase/aminodeoxychorismate synthase-like glutamine amidotransferase
MTGSGPGSGTRVFLLDNYDSFTWNLAQYLSEVGAEVEVVLNDRTTPEQVSAGEYDAVVISPGPGRPERAGISNALVRRLAGELPLLGVCLGHQAIVQAYGGRIVGAPTLMHGKTSPVRHDGRTIFEGLPDPFHATRYHSLVADRRVPAELEISAWTEDGVVMGVRHRRLPLEGVQFHPESILTSEGKRLLANFLRLAEGGSTRTAVSGRAGPGARHRPG